MTLLSRGFTLIEIMIVVAIIAILASVAYPTYQGAILKTKRAEGKSALMQLMMAQERYYSQQNTYKAFHASPDEKTFKWFSGDVPQTSFYALSAAPCAGKSIDSCVVLSATPGDALVNIRFTDQVCQILTINSEGTKGAAGKEVPTAPEGCW